MSELEKKVMGLSLGVIAIVAVLGGVLMNAKSSKDSALPATRQAKAKFEDVEVARLWMNECGEVLEYGDASEEQRRKVNEITASTDWSGCSPMLQDEAERFNTLVSDYPSRNEFHGRVYRVLRHRIERILKRGDR